MKRKVVALTASIIFILSITFLCCAEYKTVQAEVIGLSVSIGVMVASGLTVSHFYVDGKWRIQDAKIHIMSDM